LTQIYDGRGPALLVGVFRSVAEDAFKTPLDAYLAKLNGFMSWARIVLTPVIVAGLSFLWRFAFPASFSNSAGRWFRKWAVVLIAGGILGLTTSIRLLGPFAGVLVAGYWLGRDGRRAFSGLVVYAAAAAIATYLTWPVLWGNPLTAITSRLAAVPEFSRHEVLFLGQLYEANDLPWNFLPVLLAIQLTLPAVVLFLVGAPASWFASITSPKPRLFLALLWLWFLAPAAAVLIGAVPIYNNFRHLLFALPPMFLLTGFGAAVVAARIRPAGWRAALAALPWRSGLVGILRLHPYEYIYYNELVGGVRGAYGRFDPTTGAPRSARRWG
jgi:hypothetical protein